MPFNAARSASSSSNIAAGHGEDAVFEMTVAAAVGATLRSFDTGMRALENNPT